MCLCTLYCVDIDVNGVLDPVNVLMINIPHVSTRPEHRKEVYAMGSYMWNSRRLWACNFKHWYYLLHNHLHFLSRTIVGLCNNTGGAALNQTEGKNWRTPFVNRIIASTLYSVSVQLGELTGHICFSKYVHSHYIMQEHLFLQLCNAIAWLLLLET